MSETIAGRSRISVYLAGEFFTSHQAVLKRTTAMLQNYQVGDEIHGADYTFLRDLLDKHPRALSIIGCGIRAITAYQPPRRHGRIPNKSLLVLRFDNTVVAFSFSHLRLGRVNSQEEFIKAARIAVEQQLELFSHRTFKSPTSQVWCPHEKTWISYGDHAVEYLGGTLEELVDVYIKKTQLRPASIRYLRCEQREGTIQFADPDDRREWQNWHRQHAKLKIVKKSRQLREMMV